jgi:hypothetical protein
MVGHLEEQEQQLQIHKDKLENRAKAYKNIFLDGDGKLTVDAQIVFDDLKRFCKIKDSSFNPNTQFGIYINEGRRETFLRIMANLEFELEDLADFKPVPATPITKEEQNEKL